MIKTTLSIGLLTTSISFAGEQTLKTEDFKVKLSVEAQAVPQKFHSIAIDPQKWTSMPIESLLKQGSLVKKGDALINVDTKALVKEIAKNEKEQILRTLNFEQTKQVYNEQLVEIKNKIAKTELKIKRAKEDFDYKIKEVFPDAYKQLDRDLEREKSSLDYYQDEYNQLKKMYDEDDLTEETEEIVLKRNRLSLKRAKESYAKEVKDIKWKKQVQLPRRLFDAKRDFELSNLKMKSEIIMLKRSLKLKKEEFDKATKSLNDWVEHIALQKKDLEMCSIVAPCDGVVYYGSFEKGYWNSSRAQKVLYRGSKVPTKTTFMTVVPTDAAIAFTGYVTAKNRAAIKLNDKAKLEVIGTLNKADLTVKSVAKYPSLGGKWRVDFNAELPKGAFLQPGSAVKFDVISYEKKQAITVPKSSIETKADGTFSVKVKLADGKHADRLVKVGRMSGKKVEIISGLTKGQVIITPDSK